MAHNKVYGICESKCYVEAQVILPVGVILDYAGDSWTDDETMKGWYACNAENHALNPNIPDLTGAYIRGGNTAGYIGTGDNVMNGNDVPNHSHTMTHSHSGRTTGDQGIWTESACTENNRPVFATTSQVWGNQAFSMANQKTQGGYQSYLNHYHDLSINNFDGNTGVAGGADEIPIENIMKTYAVIKIMRVE